MIPELLLLVLSVLDLAFAQTTTATCSSDFNWAYNDLQPPQSPCLVAAYLGHQCAPDISYNVPPLISGQQYLPPTDQQVNICQCSSVYYSLLSACAECQRSSLATFTAWTHNCAQENITMQSYPLGTPSGTRIPLWAYIPLSNGAFDVTAAGTNATRNPNFGQDPGALSMGAIIGLAIGCIVALILVVVALWMYLRMRTVQRGHAESKQKSVASDRTGFLSGQIEGPPRKPRTFLARSTAKVVSYRPGLNFDLDKDRRGDLLELNESSKLTSRASSNEHSVESASPYVSKLSLDSSANHSKRLEHHSEPGTSYHITSLFSRAKEVKPQRGDARLDLTEAGPSEEPRKSGGPSPSNSDMGDHSQVTLPRFSGGRRPGPGILDM